MSRDRRRTLRFESLEGKQLLSTVQPAAAQPAATAPLILDGTSLAGAYNVNRLTPNVQIVKISLAGTAGALGQVTSVLTEGIDTQLQVIGRGHMIVGNALGTVTLALSHFDVIKNLTVPYNSGLTADYAIASGTGAYAHAKGTGTFEILPVIGTNDMIMTLHTTS